MKNFNLLRKSERKSVGTTLALTVGSPSFDRRGTMLKHYAFMLLFLLGSLNVWGAADTKTDIMFAKGFGGYTTNSFSAAGTDRSAVANETNATGVTYAMQVFNGSSGAVRGNQSGAANFNCRNTTTKNGYYISQVQLTVSGGTIDGSTNGRSVVYFGSSAYTNPNTTAPSGTATTAYPASSGQATLTWTNSDENVTYFILYALKTSGTALSANATTSLKVTWTEKSGTPTCATPTFSPAAGSYEGTQNVTISSTEGATIYYTTDDSDPITSGTRQTYSSPIAVSADMTIKAYAVKAEYDDSEVETAAYTITEGPDVTLDLTTNTEWGFPAGSSNKTVDERSYSNGTYTIKVAGSTGNGYYHSTGYLLLGKTGAYIELPEFASPIEKIITVGTSGGSTGVTFNVYDGSTAVSTEATGCKNVDQTFNIENPEANKIYTIKVTGNANLQVAKIKIFFGAAATVAKPTFSVAGGSYLDAQSVEINCATADADIYYTLDGTDPSSASTPYSGAISISETKTLKAIAIKGGDASAIASATYTIVVPKSVDEIWNEITSDGPTDAYVWGYVSQADVSGNNTYYISVNGSTEGNQLEIFKGDNDGHTISKGDKVVVNGDLTIWGSTKEFASGTGKVVRYSAKGAVTAVVVSGTPTKTTYSANETFETAGLVVTATYANGFSEVVTEGITWGNDLTDHKVAATGTVQVTATVGGVTSAAHGVAIEVSTKTLVSIALSAVEFEVYQGLELPKPIVTATYSEGKPEDVTAWAEFTGYDKTTPGEQTITVSYSFGGGEPIAKTYTVTVKPIYNVELAASVAKTLIETAVGETESTKDMIVRGIVSHIYNASNNVQTYWISDDGTRTNEVEIYKGKYLSGANFTTTNQLKVGDEVVVKGKVVYFNSTTPEFASGKSQLQSLARTPNFEIADVASLEVGADDLAVANLTITKDGEGAVTLTSSDKEEFVTIVDGNLHAVAPGTATITANLAANGIYKAATYEFSVTVIAAQVKYAITFDDNGADGGEAPEAIADKAAGVEVTLPANTWTKEGFTFNGWKVINNTTSEEVEVVAGAFEMPASAVTIQAQWAEIPVWAYTYTSNVELSYTGTGESNSKVIINEAEYPAQKVGSGNNDGSVVVTVPSGTHTLHFHAVAWNGTSVTITASGVENMSVSSFLLIEDAGFKASGTYTLKNDPVGQYFAMTFDAVAEETQITFSKTDGGDKRFLLYGVNQEGGIVPASIAANPASISFGSVEQNAPVAAKTINVTLTSVNSATVTLAGDDAFSIDKTSLTESGTITVTPNTATEGTYAATITISDVAEEADDVVVNVSMTVTEPVINDDVTGTWNLVTNAADLMPGMKVIVAQSVNASGTIYTMGKQNSNNRAQVESTVDGETLSPAVGTKVITLVDAGNGMFALQTSNGKYLSAAGSGTNNYLKEADDYNSNKEKWTITIADNKAKIQAASTNNRNTIRYNSSNSIFSCYAEDGQAAIVLYAKPFDYTRNVSGNYATICLPKAGKIIGATLYEIAYYGETSKKIFFDEIVNGEMEAGIPYIFQPAAGVEKINVYYSDNTAENVGAGNRNGLIGFYDLNDPAATHDITRDAGYYILYNNQYWLVSGREAYVENYRAYIQLDQIRPSEPTLAPGRRRISMSVNDTQTTTGFENGELINGENGVQKVLIDGELFILRGEKVYDAKGQLVK